MLRFCLTFIALWIGSHAVYALQAEPQDDRIEALSAKLAQNMATADELLELGELYLARGAVSSAEAALVRAQRLGADFARTAPLSARISLVQQNYVGAIEAFRGLSLTGPARIERDIIVGDAHIGLGQLEAAEAAYRRAIVSDSTDHRGFLGLARIALNRGDLDAAASSSAMARERSPNDTMAVYTSGLIERYRGNLDAAKANFQMSVAADPRNILALNELASLALVDGDLNGAEGFLDRIFQTTPSNPRALYLSAVIAARRGEFQDANRILGRVEPFVQRFVPALLVRGLVAYEVEDYDVARTAFERYVQLQPNVRQAQLGLAATYLKLNTPALAARILDPIVAAGKDLDSRILALAATAATNLGDVEKGRTLLERAQALEGEEGEEGADGVDLPLRLGIAQYVSGRADDAQQTLQRALQSRAQDVRYLGLLAQMQMSSGNLDAALATAQSLIEVAPARGLGYNIRGTVYHTRQQYADAVAAYSEALRRNSDYVTARRNRALASLALGQYARAQSDLETVLSQNPGDARARAILGRTLYQRGRYAQAAEALTTASLQLDAPPEVLVDLARALAADGKTARAIRVGRQALDGAQDQPELLKTLGELMLDIDQPQLASRALSRYRAFEPGSVDANMLYGRALLHSQLYKGALQAFNRADMLAKAQNTVVPGLAWYVAAADAYSGNAQSAAQAVGALNEASRPRDIDPIFLADIHASLGDYAAARETLRRLYRQTPSDSIALRLAETYDILGEPDQAIATLSDHIAQKSPASRDVLIALADRYRVGGRMEDAARLYERSLGSRVVDAQTAAKLARAYLALGRRESARLARQARLLDPNDPHILDTYGWTVLQAERDVRAAVPALETAVRRAPGVAEYRYHLGMAYFAAGREFDGRRALREALALSGAFDGADDARAQLSQYE